MKDLQDRLVWRADKNNDGDGGVTFSHSSRCSGEFLYVMNEEIGPIHHHESHNLLKDDEYNMSKRGVCTKASRTWPWESLLRAIFMNLSPQKSI